MSGYWEKSKLITVPSYFKNSELYVYTRQPQKWGKRKMMVLVFTTDRYLFWLWLTPPKSCLLAIAAYKALTHNVGIHAPSTMWFGSYFSPGKNSVFWSIILNGLDIHFNVVPNLLDLKEGNA